MTTTDHPSQHPLRERIGEAIAAHRTAFMVQGAVMCLLGAVAVAVPLISTLAVEILVGWLFFIGGLFRLLSILSGRHLPGFWWSVLGAVAAMAVGGLLVLSPLRGVLTLTLLLIALFTLEGVTAIVAALDWRRHVRNWAWLLVSGVVDLVLAGLIWSGWPGTATWAIGLLTGVNLFVLGISLLMLAAAAPDRPAR